MNTLMIALVWIVFITPECIVQATDVDGIMFTKHEAILENEIKLIKLKEQTTYVNIEHEHQMMNLIYGFKELPPPEY